MEKGSSTVPPDRKLPGIHGLRALAACAIVLFHVHGVAKIGIPRELSIIQDRFGLAVHLFFVLSAFSLAYSTRPTAEGIREYAVKRFFRIAPLFYVMLIAYQACFGADTLQANVLNVVFVFNVVPSQASSIVWGGWTIGVEMLFYAILPVLLMSFTTRPAALGFAAAALVFSWVSRVLLERMPSLPGEYPHFAFASNLAFFALGLAAFAFFKNAPRATGRIAAGCVAVFVTVLVFVPFGDAMIGPGRPDHLLFGVIFAVTCLWQALQPSWLMRLQVFQFLGERSYSIYLLHPLVVYFLVGTYDGIRTSTGLGDWAYVPCAALTLVLVIVAADMSYRLIEVPGIALGRRIIERRRGSQARTAASVSGTNQLTGLNL